MTAQPDTASIRLTSLSHGAGCACKLPLSALDELMAEHERGTQNLGHALWTLLTLELFLRRHDW